MYSLSKLDARKLEALGLARVEAEGRRHGLVDDREALESLRADAFGEAAD